MTDHTPSRAADMRLSQLLARTAPYNTLAPALLRQIDLRKVICKRNQVLSPQPGSLYLVLSGRAKEIQATNRGKTVHLETYLAGDTVGWWPVDGFIEHAVETHYAVIAARWACEPELLALRHRAVAARVKKLHARLAVWGTCTIAERIELDPPKQGESISDVARRIGCSREMASRVLSNRRANQAQSA